MAQRRMFNKSITNSSLFLKMPVSSRLLYYDLGMNADDDGYVEHFMVMRMTGATEQDLGVLEANGMIIIFDSNVLIITNWKENNYIQKDRYTPSKYLNVYQLDTQCIQDVYTGKDSIGKVSIDKNSIELNNNSISIYDFIQENFGRTLSPIEYEEISRWEDGELTRYAIKQAVLNGKYNIKYIASIINNYEKNSIKSIQQVQEQEANYKKSKEMPKKSQSEKIDEMVARLEREANEQK